MGEVRGSRRGGDTILSSQNRFSPGFTSRSVGVYVLSVLSTFGRCLSLGSGSLLLLIRFALGTRSASSLALSLLCPLSLSKADVGIFHPMFSHIHKMNIVAEADWPEKSHIHKINIAEADLARKEEGDKGWWRDFRSLPLPARHINLDLHDLSITPGKTV